MSTQEASRILQRARTDGDGPTGSDREARTGAVQAGPSPDSRRLDYVISRTTDDARGPTREFRLSGDGEDERRAEPTSSAAPCREIFALRKASVRSEDAIAMQWHAELESCWEALKAPRSPAVLDEVEEAEGRGQLSLRGPKRATVVDLEEDGPECFLLD